MELLAGTMEMPFGTPLLRVNTVVRISVFDIDLMHYTYGFRVDSIPS